MHAQINFAAGWAGLSHSLISSGVEIRMADPRTQQSATGGCTTLVVGTARLLCATKRGQKGIMPLLA
jgi:hypothetical protein